MGARFLGAGVLLACLALPRALILALVEPPDWAVFGRHVAATGLFVALLLAVRELVAGVAPRLAGWLLVPCVQVSFALATFEAVLLLEFSFGFNSLTFVHAGPGAFEPLVLDYGTPLLLGVVALLAVSWAVGVFVAHPPALSLGARRVAIGAGGVALLSGVGLAAAENVREELPAWSFVRAAREHSRIESPELDLEPSEIALLEQIGLHIDASQRRPRLLGLPEQRPNLILVILESFQDNFTAAGGSPFPNLTPNIDRIAARMTRVENAYNAVTPTIRAMAGILCGSVPYRPPDYEYFSEYRSVTCLSDLLHAAGYRQAFLGAASKGFTNKGFFLRSHHYDEVYGDEDFREKYQLFHRTSWGIHDLHLADEALARLEVLAEKPPFNLTLLTINTHKPGYPSPYCPTYMPDNRYLNGIHCTDFAIGKLFEGIEAMGLLETSVVVLVGDHMAFPNRQTKQDLGGDVAKSYFGKIFLAIHSPLLDLPPVLDAISYTPDLAPTILELMGFDLAIPFVFGKSILGARDAFPHLVGPDMEVFEGELYPRRRKVLAKQYCTEERLLETRLSDLDRALDPCERMRIITRVDRWLQAAPPAPLVEPALRPER